MATQESTALVPLQLDRFTPDDFAKQVDKFNQQWAILVQRVNYLGGVSGGAVKLEGPLDMSGNQVINVGPATSPGHVITKEVADAHYGAAVVGPQLEPGGSHPLKGVRRLNDQTQREMFSTHMTGMLNTSPAANTSTVTYAPPVGSTVVVTVSSGYLSCADGKTSFAYAMRQDTLTLPTVVTITAMTRAASEVTATSAAHGLSVGQSVYVTSSDATFVGLFTIDTVPDVNHFTYPQIAPDAGPVAGSASLGSVYYYFLNKSNKTLFLVGPFSSDTPANRIQANIDGTVLVAVATINGAGGDSTASGGGGTPSAQTGGKFLAAGRLS